MSRIYPKGGRVDSSNYMPQVVLLDFCFVKYVIRSIHGQKIFMLFLGYTSFCIFVLSSDYSKTIFMNSHCSHLIFEHQNSFDSS